MHDRPPLDDGIISKLSLLTCALEDIEAWISADREGAGGREAASVRTLLATVLSRRRLTPENLESFLQ